MDHGDPKALKIPPRSGPRDPAAKGKVPAVGECFCPNGHSLLYPRANFNGHPGILLKVTGEKGTGHVVLSPIYGDKSRIALDIDLLEGEILIVHCPFCGSVFARLGSCPCGADLVTVNATPVPDGDNCIGICNRVGCTHAEVRTKGDLILLSMMTDLADP